MIFTRFGTGIYTQFGENPLYLKGLLDLKDVIHRHGYSYTVGTGIHTHLVSFGTGIHTHLASFGTGIHTQKNRESRTGKGLGRTRKYLKLCF